jgi:hypothetical protein
MTHVISFPTKSVLYLYTSAVASICAVLNAAVSAVLCFLSRLSSLLMFLYFIHSVSLLLGISNLESSWLLSWTHSCLLRLKIIIIIIINWILVEDSILCYVKLLVNFLTSHSTINLLHQTSSQSTSPSSVHCTTTLIGSPPRSSFRQTHLPRLLLKPTTIG